MLAASLSGSSDRKLVFEDRGVLDVVRGRGVRGPGKLLGLQKGNGAWTSTEGRWMESDPLLTTSYILMALGRIHQTMQAK